MTYVHTSDRLWAKSKPATASGLIARLTAVLRQRRARRELAQLSPELLRDIGLVDQVYHDRPDARSLTVPPSTWGNSW